MLHKQTLIETTVRAIVDGNDYRTKACLLCRKPHSRGLLKEAGSLFSSVKSIHSYQEIFIKLLSNFILSTFLLFLFLKTF